MFFKFTAAFFLIFIINPAKVLSYDKCNEFTITFDEITDIHNIKTFDFGSFGILNNLTKQCRNLNIAIELDLYRDEEKSKLYKNLYGDDLHKLNVTYPLDSDVHEEVITPACPEICSNPDKEDRSYYSTILKPIFTQPKSSPEFHNPFPEEFETVETYAPSTDYPYFATDSETTTELTTTEMSYRTNDSSDSTKAEKFKKTRNNEERNNEGNKKAAIIALASVAGVATVGIVSYYAAQMIKTMLQLGEFSFPRSCLN